MPSYYMSEDLARFGEISVVAVIRGGGTLAHWAQSCNALTRREI